MSSSGLRAAGIATGVALLLLAFTITACGGRSRSSHGHARSAGTAFLQAATCSDWRRAGEAARRQIVRAMSLAATKPDPENRGATLDARDAYSLFQRACSTRQSRSAVLYEIYNRAAAFRRVRGGSPAP